jgi:hypothetical protein
LISNDEVFQPSPATVFAYLDDVNDFEEISPELNELWERVKEEAEDDDFGTDLFEKFAERIKDDAIVCFEITTCGIACGPVSSTIRIAINMNYYDEAEAEE